MKGALKHEQFLHSCFPLLELASLSKMSLIYILLLLLHVCNVHDVTSMTIFSLVLQKDEVKILIFDVTFVLNLERLHNTSKGF